MTGVSVIGLGMTKFGEQWNMSLKDLMVEAGTKAILDSGVDGPDIDAIYGGSMSAGRLIGQEHIGALIADQSGLTPMPATRVEAACASGALALRQAILSILSGVHDVVVVGGVEKMTDVATSQATTTLGGAADREWESSLGVTFPALYALIARRHMKKYGTTEKQMAMVAVKNHKNGALNPLAQYQYEISVDDVMNSAIVSSPLKLFDCSPITDGAAALVLARDDIAKKYSDKAVKILASEQASDTLALHDRRDITTLDATVISSRAAFKRANLLPKDINIAEVHDCFTIAEICAIEDLGFFNKGEGGKAVEEGETNRNSTISVNTSGGLKACGHPVGATGVKQVVEIATQLRGDAEKRQVDADIGLAHNVGGSGATAIVHILSL